MMLIIKDAIMLMVRCLITTILVGVCVENGWLFSSYATDISYSDFWKFYSAIIVLVPIIMFYRGLTGSYKVEIKECNSNDSMGTAIEDCDDKSDECNNNK